jgi:hypoxia up-regulated 1
MARLEMILAMMGVLLLSCAVVPTSSFVLGIDVGAEFMKVALVQPGRPIELVTNVESKRKTQMIVGFNGDERIYGGSALNYLPRKPDRVFTGMRMMLGRSVDHPRVKQLKEKQYQTAKVVADKAGRSAFLLDAGKDSEKLVNTESLLAMILRNAKSATADFKEKSLKDVDVRDAVFTVPSYFTQTEKESLVVAAEMADLKVLALIDENTAAAVQYARDKNFEDNAENVLIYNLGYDSLQVTIAQYSDEVAVDGTTGTIEIKGKAFDTSVGAGYFDSNIVNFLADEFKSKQGTDPRSVPRAIAKLLKDVPKLKTVLSASKRKPVTIPSFHDEKDLKADLTRAGFEKFSSSLFSKVKIKTTTPIEKANFYKCFPRSRLPLMLLLPTPA